MEKFTGLLRRQTLRMDENVTSLELGHEVGHLLAARMAGFRRKYLTALIIWQTRLALSINFGSAGSRFGAEKTGAEIIGPGSILDRT